MALAPKPIVLTQVDTEDYNGLAPQPLVVIGDIPGTGGAAVTWSTLSGKPATFPPTVGTTAGTAFDGAAATTQLAAKAPLASPTFTGSPKSTTAALADSSTNIATTAFVLTNAGKTKTAIAALAALATDADLPTAVLKINSIIAALKA